MISAAFLAIVGLTTSASLSAPQGKGGGGGHGGGHGGGNPGGGHGGNPGHPPGHGYYPGYPGYPGYYPGYPGYYPGYGYGYGFPWGSLAGFALGRASGYGGSGIGSNSSPYYYPSDSSTSQGQYYGPAPYDSQPPLADAASTQARITVLLPAEAQLLIDAYVSRLTGPARVLMTPPLDPSQTFSYTLVAKWNEDGREVSRTREVKFRAGESMTVNMTLPEPISPPPQPAPPPKPMTPGRPITPPVPPKS
jgi:uncharacterized protein (TIGR03000 family)